MEALGSLELTLPPEVLLLVRGVDPVEPGDPDAITLSLGPGFPRFLGSFGFAPGPSTDPLLEPGTFLSRDVPRSVGLLC